MEENIIYYIYINGEQKGPFRIEQLVKEGLTMEAMVWRPGLENWKPASQIPELVTLFERPFVEYEPQSELHRCEHNSESQQQPDEIASNHQAYMPNNNQYEHTNSYSPDTSSAQHPQQPYRKPEYVRSRYQQPQSESTEYYDNRQSYAVGTLPENWTNWSVWAIISCILGFLFCGALGGIVAIFAIVKANSANEAARRRDPQAYQLNSTAKTLTIISFIINIIMFIISIFLTFLVLLPILMNPSFYY